MKRITSLILTLAMLLALVPSVTAAADGRVFTDVTGTEYYAPAAEKLHELKIITGYVDGSFGADKAVTRSEMAAIMCRMIGKEADAGRAKGKTAFEDVPENNWASGYINVASKEGIINGGGDGRFRPTDDVTHEEAVKMVVCAIGLADEVIPDPNDWAKGYLDAADRRGITKELKGVRGSASTRGDVAVMVCNALFTEITGEETVSLGGSRPGAVTVNVAGTGSSSPRVQYADAADTDEMKTIAVAEVYLAGGEALDGAAEIRIKYDANRGLDATNLLPGYFNEATGQWETVPYWIDEENSEVVIITDHFSKYGVFEVEASGTPRAFAKPLDAARMAQMKPETAAKILEKFNAGGGTLDEDTVGGVLEALDGAFNGKVMGTCGNVVTIVSASGIESKAVSSAGKQLAVVAVLGACVSAANNTYKYGLTDTKTLKEITKAGIGAGAAFAATPVALAYVVASIGVMTYEQMRERELTQKHDQLKTIFDFYKKQRGERSLAEWKQLIDPFYEKYYVNELSSTTDNAEEIYNKFYNSVHNVISGYAYEFMQDYASGELYDRYLNVPLYDGDTGQLADDLCYNYEVELYESLSALFLQYSRRAYSDAVKKLQAECEKERQELNKQITLRFYESEPSGKAQNYYVRFYDKKSDQWRADFDASGNATLSFTLLSYLQMDSPGAITVFEKGTDRAVGRIEFPPNSLAPGKTTDIPFDTDNVRLTVNIHEVKEQSTDEYQFAGCGGRLAPLSEDAALSDYIFNLDSSGCGSLTMTLGQYYRDGAPDRLEIVDGSGVVVYQTFFDPAMSEIALDGGTCSLDISCEDEESVAVYRGRRAEIVYFEHFDAKPTVVAEGKLDKNGECALLFSKSEFVFREKDYTLWIYDESGSEVEQNYDLSNRFGEDNLAAGIILSYEEPEPKEVLTLNKAYIELKKGSSASVSATSGHIIGGSSGDGEIAAVSGTTVTGKDVGDTYVTFYGKDGDAVSVYVTVTDDGSPMGDTVYFEMYTTYECSNVINFKETHYAVGEKLVGTVKAVFYTGLYGIGRIDFYTPTGYSATATFMLEQEPNRLYRYNFGDGWAFEARYVKSSWIDFPSRGGFTEVFHYDVDPANGYYTETRTTYVPCAAP